MRIVVGIPVFNEMFFIDQSVSNAVFMGYDKVVYLDDGSTDGTYEKLLEYSNKYESVEVFSNDKNSILSKGTNRWKVLAEHCRQFDPDWIMVRAADQTFSVSSKLLLRNRLEEIYLKKNAHMVSFPVVHFWRSPWWYRIDGYWGNSAKNHVSNSCWRNDCGWEFTGEFTVSGMHRGVHHPNNFKTKYGAIGINYNFHKYPFPISVLHYGMSSNELLEKKLDHQLNMSLLSKNNNFLIPANKMPHPSSWNNHNGYKIAYEKGMILEKAHSDWFDIPIPNVDKPKVVSMYNTIKKYNAARAKEYAKIYGE